MATPQIDAKSTELVQASRIAFLAEGPHAVSDTSNPTSRDAAVENARLHQRVSELETRYSFLDDLLATLNDVIAQQDRRLADIQRELDTAVRQLRQIDTSARATSPGVNEPPPHF